MYEYSNTNINYGDCIQSVMVKYKYYKTLKQKIKKIFFINKFKI